jgi:hypothetical protein
MTSIMKGQRPALLRGVEFENRSTGCLQPRLAAEFSEAVVRDVIATRSRQSHPGGGP